MNIELDEVVVQDVSDDALELAAGGAQGGLFFFCCEHSLNSCLVLTPAAPVTYNLGV